MPAFGTVRGHGVLVVRAMVWDSYVHRRSTKFRAEEWLAMVGF